MLLLAKEIAAASLYIEVTLRSPKPARFCLSMAITSLTTSQKSNNLKRIQETASLAFCFATVSLSAPAGDLYGAELFSQFTLLLEFDKFMAVLFDVSVVCEVCFTPLFPTLYD